MKNLNALTREERFSAEKMVENISADEEKLREFIYAFFIYKNASQEIIEIFSK